MKRCFFLFVAVASSFLVTGCVPNLPSLDDEGGANDGSFVDGRASDGHEDAADGKADGKAAHEEAGEKDGSKSDGAAKEDGASEAEAGCPAADLVCGDSGTCVHQETDPKNCGACGNDCTLAPHVDPQATTCSGGQCVYACAAGFADDCGGDAGAGCPTSLSTSTNCGSCGHACTTPTPLCSASAVPGGAATCASTCTGSTALCGTSCVNAQTDPSACGSACTVCQYLCTNGGCTGSCTPGTTGCSGPTPEMCDTTANWDLGTVTAGQCGAVCAPNATRCNGAVPQTCNASGQWVSGTVTAGQCGAVCMPSATQCDVTVPQTCNASGQWVSGTVAVGTCGAVCTPGATQCDAADSTMIETCGSNGEWVNTACMGATPSCTNGACLGSCQNPYILNDETTAGSLTSDGQWAILTDGPIVSNNGVDGYVGTTGAFTSPINHRGTITGYAWVEAAEPSGCPFFGVTYQGMADTVFVPASSVVYTANP